MKYLFEKNYFKRKINVKVDGKKCELKKKKSNTGKKNERMK